MQLRDYQINLSDQGVSILQKYGIVYYALEVRCGKTIISLETCKKYGAKRVLFITKLKAISSIKTDYEFYKNDFDLSIINYESIHKLDTNNFDIVICDEVHSKLSGFPKPSESFKIIKKMFSKIPTILLSGTPLIESSSKIYPQLNWSTFSPFRQYQNFYKWYKDYGIPKIIYTSYGQTTDYTNSKYDEIMKATKHLFLTFTQKEAGFTTEVKETVLKVKMKDETYKIIEKLKKDKVIQGKDDTILADTSVKLQICLHQLYSGTIKLESGKAITTDDTKAKFIKDYFKNKKIAIFYCFIQEKELLKNIFGDNITDNLEEFKNTNKSFLGQFVSCREGISLKEAEALVFYNIPFSGTSYVQGRDRLSYLGRTENNLYIICSEGGIEEKIYKIVKQKKNFTNKIFKLCL